MSGPIIEGIDQNEGVYAERLIYNAHMSRLDRPIDSAEKQITGIQMFIESGELPSERTLAWSVETVSDNLGYNEDIPEGIRKNLIKTTKKFLEYVKEKDSKLYKKTFENSVFSDYYEDLQDLAESIN